MRRLLPLTALFGVICCVVTPLLQAQDKPLRTIGDFLLATSAPRAKSLQRTSRFLGFEGHVDRIQLVFVLDGTESMTEEFASLRKNLDLFAAQLLDSYGGSKTKLQLTAVVYRDTKAPHPVQVLSREFLDLESFKKRFESMEIETGAPHYQERVDEGLNAAMDELAWIPGDAEGVARCILLCGDAPPYSEDKADYKSNEQRQAYRKYSTDALVEKANTKGISIHGIHCSSAFQAGDDRNENLARVAKELRPAMATFMRSLAARTGGGFIDTSDPDEVRKMVDKNFRTVRAVSITKENIQAARQEAAASSTGPTVRLVVLPHAPFESMASEPWFRQANSEGQPRSEVLVATQMRQLLPELGQNGIIVGSPNEVSEQVRRVAAESTDDSERISLIAASLNADYVVWGKYEEKGAQSVLTSGIYNGVDGRLIVRESNSASSDSLQKQTQLLLRKLSSTVSSSKSQFANDNDRLAFTKDGQWAESAAMITPLARDLRAQRALLAGLELLEQGLGYLKPAYENDLDKATEGRQLLERSLVQLNHVVSKEPDNPLAHLWIACCHYNLGDKGMISHEHKPFTEHLAKAYEYRNQTLRSLTGVPAPFLDESRRKEVEAYYALFNNRPKEAAKLFAELSEVKSSVRGNVALRAHWMLAGIHLGDWGVSSTEPKLCDITEARKHILQILSRWKGCPEEKFYSECLFGEQPSGATPGSANIELTSNFEPFH